MLSLRRSIIRVLAIAAVLLAGCAGPAVAPTPEVRLALAPTGKLRVGVYPGSPTSMVKDAASGETRGVTYELGRELAARLGVPFEPVVFPRVAEVIEGLKSGRADVTFTNATPVRAKDLDFTPPLLAIEQGFLVPAGSALVKVAEVDQPGRRVGVSAGSSSESILGPQLKHATLVRAPTLKEALEMLSSGKLDAFATNKAILSELSDQLLGSRILEGRFGLEHMALGIPKGRGQAAAYVSKFAEDAQAEGLIQKFAQRAGVRGTASPESK
jgi:polar amino acid transport system substrate-binding protein